MAHTKFGEVNFADEESLRLALLLANSKLMMVFWFAVADDFDVTRWNFDDFPTDLKSFLKKTYSRRLYRTGMACHKTGNGSDGAIHGWRRSVTEGRAVSRLPKAQRKGSQALALDV